MIKMVRRFERLFWTLALVIAAAVAVWPTPWWKRPYWGVELVEAYELNGEFYITASFQKGECTLTDIEFLGKRLGLPEKLDWHAMDGFDGDLDDRTAGSQLLKGRLDLEGNTYESFEIRTSHNCNGQRVDGVFLRIQLGGGLTNDN